MAVVVVLGLISITLALSYAMLRSQGTALVIQQNSRRRGDARQAAMSGLMAGLGRMHQSRWEGVGSTLVGTLSASESYTVQYEAGDPRLTPAQPEFRQLPWRVTLHATGYRAADHGGAAAVHKLRAVVQLVPRNVSPSPPDWPRMRQFTLYQWTEGDVKLELPVRIEGPVWMQGKLKLADDYPAPNEARSRYLGDLNAMRLAGRPDDRPFSGPIHWRNIQDGTMIELVTNQLGVSTTSIGKQDAAWSTAGMTLDYRLYPGGPVYQTPWLGRTLEDIALGPDPQTNPLGRFYCNGSLELKDNVSIEGELIASERVLITGSNVNLRALDLPAIDPGGYPVRLPVALVGDEVRVEPTASATLQGAVIALDGLEIRDGSEKAVFQVLGPLVTKTVKVGKRWEWDYGSSTWSTLYDAFKAQLNASQNPITYFPDFLARFGRRPAARLRFAPNPQPRLDHLPGPGEPVYAPLASDPGMRWELIDWQDQG